MPAIRSPGTVDLVREPLALLELPRLGLSLLNGLSRRCGRGESAMVLPGWTTDDRSTAPLRVYLRRVGFDARGWGLGRNHGDVEALMPEVEDATRNPSEEAGIPVGLIGWSLGEVLAREVARDAPELVSAVITFGAAIVGGPLHPGGRQVLRGGRRRDRGAAGGDPGRV